MKNNMNELKLNELEKINGGYIRKNKDGGWEVLGDGYEEAMYFSKEEFEKANI